MHQSSRNKAAIERPQLSGSELDKHSKTAIVVVAKRRGIERAQCGEADRVQIDRHRHGNSKRLR